MEKRQQSPLDIVQAVWQRRRWLAVTSFVLPLTLAVGIVAFLPAIYKSTATVLVDRQQVPEAFVRPTVTSGVETRLQTISQEVFSRARLEDIISRFGLYADLKNRVSAEQVIERMRQDIQLEYRGVERGPTRGTVAFAVSYRGTDRQLVAQVTNTLASAFIEENLKVRERQASGTAEFLKVQLAEVKARLDSQEREVSAFKRRHHNELPQQVGMNLGIIERLDAQLRLNLDAQTRLGERREVVARRMAELGGLPTAAGLAAAAPRGPVAPPLAAADPRLIELARLQQELRSLRSQYSDKYPDVVRLAAVIAGLETELKDKPWAPPGAVKAEAKTGDPAPTAAADPVQLVQPGNPHLLPLRQSADDLEAEIRALKAEEQRLRATIAIYVARVQNAPKIEQEFKEVSRDYETTKEFYTTLTKRYEEAQIAESMEQRQKGEQFRILDPAMPAQEPVAPSRTRSIVMAIVMSLGLSVGLVVATERIRPTVHSVDALRALTTVPVLLSIPAIVTGRDIARRHRQARLATAGLVLGVLVLIGISYVVANGNEYLVSLMMRGRG